MSVLFPCWIQNHFHEYDLFVEHAGKDFDMDKKYLPGDGVITGTGLLAGHPVCIFAQDFTVAGGSLGWMHAKKITKIMDHALKMKVPLIGINDSGGARIQEGVNSLAGYGEIFFRNTLASGVIPQISVILGPCAGGAVYSPALTDFVFVVDKISKMFITGPEVIKTVLGEEISMEELGGARVHCEITGNAHFFAESEEECFSQIKKLVSFIPWNNTKKAETFPKKSPKTRQYKIDDMMPSDPRMPYDVRDVIKAISDDSEFLEVQELFAPNIVIGFARIDGKTVGIVANQPLVLAGVLDVDSSDKAARFIRYCDAFNIPLVTLLICRVICRELIRNMPVLSGMEQNYCMPTQKLLFQKLPLLCEKHMVVDILPCVRTICVPILYLPGHLPKLQLWVLKVLPILFSEKKLQLPKILKKCANKKWKSTRKNLPILMLLRLMDILML